jgi:hypothetical protein
MKELLNFILSTDTLLFLLSFILGTYIILYKYNDKRYIFVFITMLLLFITLWKETDKYIWVAIFIHLTITMIIMENLVVYITNGKAISYNSSNLFNKIPYWLPIAYWNNIIFVVYHFRLYSIIKKTYF